MGDEYENAPSCWSKRKFVVCRWMTSEGGLPANIFNISCAVFPKHADQHQCGPRPDVSWPDILVGGLAARAVASAVTEADRRPALFRELRPSCADVSRRARFCGRGAWLPAPLGVGPALMAGFALVGALLAVMEGDGEGDGRAGPVPFVCMPGGIGRLAFPAGTGGGAAVATGPIASVSEGFARAGGRVRIGCPDRLWFRSAVPGP